MFFFILCFHDFADSQLEVGVLVLLPFRIEFVGLWLCEILTIFGGCICHVSFEIHNPIKVTSLGKNLIFILAYFSSKLMYRRDESRF